jgi:hypothetical protein
MIEPTAEERAALAAEREKLGSNADGRIRAVESERTEAETEQPAPAVPIAADTFAAVNALVALVIDPKACGARLKALQEREAAALRQEAQLATARAEHDAFVQKGRDETAAQWKRMNAREKELTAREGQVEQTKRFGARSLSALLRTLGLVLVVCEDPDAKQRTMAEGVS